MADENDESAAILINSDDDEYLESGTESENEGGSERDRRRRIEADDASSPEENSQRNELNLGEIDGLMCPICIEAWTDDGDHHIWEWFCETCIGFMDAKLSKVYSFALSCLPCGHIYGMSCINRWLKQRKNQGKCPQCNRKSTPKDVRKLFASRLVAVDEKLQKRIRSLEAKCASHEKKRADWRRKEAEWRKKDAELQSKFQELTERTTHLEGMMGDLSNKPSRSVNAGAGFQGKSASGSKFFPIFRRKESLCHFTLQEELQVDGAHLFDVDASNKILLFACSLPGIGAKHLLTKMSMLHPHEREDILLPHSTNLIKDLHFSPSNDGLALFTSLGKKLSLFSPESNSVVLAYDLPAAGWTCSWDLNISHYMYAGLQNGSVIMFDKRQTREPAKVFQGLTSNPIHTLHSLSNSSNLHSVVSSVMSASSSGLCQWNFDGACEPPTYVPETDKQGVCISLAYSPLSDDIVASYRPEVKILSETAISQPWQTPSQITGRGIIGSHVQYQRSNSRSFQKSSSSVASLSQIRLPKSTIIETEENKLFACRPEGSPELVLQDLPSFSVFQRLNLAGNPLRDIKYTNSPNRGLLGCLSGDTLQIFGT